MKKLLILGTSGESARVLREAEAGGAFEVVAFIGSASDSGKTCLGRPILAMEDAQRRFARTDASIFACGDASFLNQDRLARYMEAKKSGYAVTGIVSPTASVAASTRIRENVFIDAQVRVLEGANIGANTWILQQAFVGEQAQLGSSCWLGPGASVGGSAALGKNCTLGMQVAVANGVKLHPWTTIHGPRELTESPRTIVFNDPLFRAEVILRTSDSDSDDAR